MQSSSMYPWPSQLPHVSSAGSMAGDPRMRRGMSSHTMTSMPSAGSLRRVGTYGPALWPTNEPADHEHAAHALLMTARSVGAKALAATPRTDTSGSPRGGADAGVDGLPRKSLVRLQHEQAYAARQAATMQEMVHGGGIPAVTNTPNVFSVQSALVHAAQRAPESFKAHSRLVSKLNEVRATFLHYQTMVDQHEKVFRRTWGIGKAIPVADTINSRNLLHMALPQKEHRVRVWPAWIEHCVATPLRMQLTLRLSFCFLCVRSFSM